MRHGELVQIGTGDQLVGAPADDYVADFVSEVPRADVLTLKWIVKPGQTSATDPVLPIDTVIRNAIPAVLGTTGPVGVSDGNRIVGIVTRDDILQIINASHAVNAPDGKLSRNSEIDLSDEVA